MSTIPLIPATPDLRQAAVELAAVFHLPVLDTIVNTLPFVLCLTPDHLELRDQQTMLKPLFIDFTSGAVDYRRRYGGGRKQPLGRAIGLKQGAMPTVIDATAGLGRDAFVLACLGCHVRMIERSPVIAALLQDGLQRAKKDLEISQLVTERLHLIHADAQHWLTQLPSADYPDVIYLDPMYPHRQKTALVKKAMRWFRTIVGDDIDAPLLLNTALLCAKRRVVVKRPKIAKPLGDLSPTVCIQSDNTRFDVYVK